MEKTNKTNYESLFQTYLILLFIIFFISIIIPYYLIQLNHEINGCFHHVSFKIGHKKNSYVWGRSLGFTSLIWLIIASVQGYKTNLIAKKLHSKKKAWDLHCLSATFCNIAFFLHIILLISSDPWNPYFQSYNPEHNIAGLVFIKIITGIIFGIIMIFTSFISYYTRDIKRLKKIGFKRFIKIHKFMMITSILLGIHIILLNTELWVMGII